MNRVCNRERVPVKDEPSLDHRKVYVHLHCCQCCGEKGFVWGQCLHSEDKSPKARTTLTAGRFCCMLRLRCHYPRCLTQPVPLSPCVVPLKGAALSSKRSGTPALAPRSMEWMYLYTSPYEHGPTGFH